MQLFEYIDMPNQPYDIFYTDSVDSQLHWHYYSEVLYITKGTVTITCNNKNAVLEEGDLCYIYPLQLHTVSKANDNATEYAVLKFDVHTINIPQAYLSKFYDIFIRRSREEDFCIILKNTCIEKTKMNSLIQHIVNEFQEENAFYALQIQADIYTLLIEIARKIKKENKHEDKKRTDTDFSFYHILEYIDSHSGEQLEIQKLADMCHMSYSHFAKLFRENYGRSCKEYITYIRLNKAQDLLLHTDYDLNYIALETGFFDCSHFIRTYKKWRGITPKQERMKKHL
ncbi:AraC family transcriptional regulator [Ruminococcus sp.]|uniref:AraC family transcriptional regulator n=1 Tax=Ruminococcus sp. TaxID=41978 RepID=UPI0025D74866|nr:AraC family transcriptional regulator [Ruminococcus sp.]